MSVTITITGSDAAEAVKELSSLAKSFAPSSGTVVAPKAEEPKADPKPKADKLKAEEPKADPKPKAVAGPSLPKDGTEREKASVAFMKAAIEDVDTHAAALATYPVDDQYTLLRQFGIELMQTGRKSEFDKANADFGIKALKEISTDSAKMAVHFKTLAGLLAV